MFRKNKYIGVKSSNYITKVLRKENESKTASTKQRNVCLSLLRQTERNYFPNLDTKIVK